MRSHRHITSQFIPTAALNPRYSNNRLKKALISLVWATSMALTASAWAQEEDPLLLVQVREQHQASISTSLSNSTSHADEISRFPDFYTSGSSSYRATTLSFGGNLGLGYGLEAYGSLPYRVRAHSEFTFNDSSSTYDNSGLGDLSAGLKYKVWSDPAAKLDVVASTGFMHHSANVNVMSGLLSVVKTFPQAFTGVLSIGASKVQGGSNGVSLNASTSWTVSPSVKLTPSVGYAHYAGTLHQSGHDSTSVGLSAYCLVDAQWALVPAVSLARADPILTDYYVNNHGAAKTVNVSVMARRSF
jgi:hypothetical protein